MKRNPFLIERPARVAFSGGRTSGRLLWGILQAYGGTLPDDIIVTFANTGREFEQTLEFVRDCEVNWNVKIRWVEYCRTDDPVVKSTPAGKRQLIGCHGWKEVTFDTASRNGEPFEAIINVKADFRAAAKGLPPVLPNPTDRWCSGELKQRTMDRLMKALGYECYTVAVGIRADERKRAVTLAAQATQEIDYCCPLVEAGINLDDVMRFWKSQPFDLKLRHDPELGTYEGNCDNCFLKKTAKIVRMAVESPEKLDWWARMERETGQRFRRDRISFQELAEKRVSLQLCENDEDLGTCLCTD